MKKTRKTNQKLTTLLLATAIPLSATGVALTMLPTQTTLAVAPYSTGAIKSVTVTNGNFNSSSSSGLSEYPTGWSKKYTDGKSTAGVINTGSSFENNMKDYCLGENPFTNSQDKFVLMINSQTKTSLPEQPAKQRFRSNSITLNANSFYSLQTSFKSSPNHNTEKRFVYKGEIREDDTNFTIDFSTFDAQEKDFIIGEDVYISFRYDYLRDVYLKKSLTPSETKITEVTKFNPFYTDDNVVGFMHNGTPIYVEKQYVEENTDEADKDTYSHLVDGLADGGVATYTCSLEYDSASNKFKVAPLTQFYVQTDVYTSLNDFAFGSVVIDGLKDADGKPVKAEFLKVNSGAWTTLYFFIATGNQSQTINLDLWLGTEDEGSTGVVFFDDVKAYQYSENEFFKQYQNYVGRKYYQAEYRDNSIVSDSFPCTQILDLRTEKEILDVVKGLNFNFEDDNLQNPSSLEKWTLEKGHAQIFNTDTAYRDFKTITGFDYVGSNYACTAVIDGEKVEISNNKKLLAVWANDSVSKVTSGNIAIGANQIYKITVQYKVSGITSGNAYIFVKENGSVVYDKDGYNRSENDYTLAAEVASSGFSTNPDNDFINDYGTVEFYVKGGAHFNSSVNLSLGLGKDDENATGCVLFDDITIEEASSTEYSSATNKIELDTKSGSQTITNGNFRNVTVPDDKTCPYTADGWTVSSGLEKNLQFAGVINTDPNQYKEFKKLYDKLKNQGVEDKSNPYYWTTYDNPKASNGKAEPNNVMMLLNCEDNYQTLSSSTFSLEKTKSYLVTFMVKNLNFSEGNTRLKISIVSSDGITLYEDANFDTASNWKEYKVYIKANDRANADAHIEISLGEEDDMVKGAVYLDNFSLLADQTIPSNAVNVVDMTNDYLNLKTNKITGTLIDNPDTQEKASYSPAYDAKKLSGDNQANGGIIKTSGLDDIYKVTEEGTSDTAFLMYSQGVGSFEIQSKFNISLDADTCYKLSFKLKTHFTTNLDPDTDYHFGVSVGLTGYKLAEGLRSDEYELFEIYFKPKAEASVNYYISLINDTNETGSAAIYDFKLEPLTVSNDYDDAKELVAGGNYDVNKDRVFVSSENDSTPDSDTPEEEPETTPSAPSQNFDWILIPTLIMGVALVIAIVGYFLRKVKIKKIELKRKETYDRKSSLHVDAIKQAAAKERDKEVEEMQKTISVFETELQNLEKEHKKKVIAMREQDKNKVSKSTDKEFKLFAQKRTVLSEKIDSLKHQLEELKTPEHLLSLERKIYMLEDAKRREIEKASKKEAKQNKKDAK